MDSPFIDRQDLFSLLLGSLCILIPLNAFVVGPEPTLIAFPLYHARTRVPMLSLDRPGAHDNRPLKYS